MKFGMKRTVTLIAACGTVGAGLSAGVAIAAGKSDPLVARGKYVVTIGGCNDCHTAHYAASEGKVPEKDWLQGDILGWKGPWGTTYGINLRNYMSKLTEAQWVAKAKTLQARPPMPAVNVRQMTDQDLKAVYRYVKSLGAGGNEAPAYVPPNQTPSGLFVSFPSPPPGASGAPPASPAPASTPPAPAAPAAPK
jgi:mono/diheme cytochrome c family protein